MDAKPLPESLPAAVIDTWRWDAEATREVVGINICDLLTHLFPDYWDMDTWATRSYAETNKAVLAWCAEHGAHYYARGREDFSYTEAREEAMAQGLGRVVYEDLS